MSRTIGITYNGGLGFNRSIHDVKEFLRIYQSDKEFLDYINPDTGLKNRDYVFRRYSQLSKINLGLADKYGQITSKSTDITSDMPCPIGEYFVNAEFVEFSALHSQSNVLTNDFQVDFDKDKQFIVKDNVFYEKLVQTSFSGKNKKTNFSGSSREAVQATVWVWSKSLNPNGEFNSNSLFNLTPFINQISLNQTQNGGNFSFDLVPIEGMFKVEENEPKEYWRPDKKRYVKFKEKDKTNYSFRLLMNKLGSRKTEDRTNDTYGQRYQNTSVNGLNYRDREFEQNKENDYNRSEVFFKNLISENDIVFIALKNYDSLDSEEDFFMSNKNIPYHNWDMIGLVDTNQLKVTHESTEQSLNISGRDCMKLLIEDGSYFFPKAYSNPDNINTAFNNTDIPSRGDDNNTFNRQIQKNPSMNRLLPTGLISVLFNPEARNVNFVMNLLMSTLSNIEICHSELFDNYPPEQRTKFKIPIYETFEENPDEVKESEDGD